MVKTSTLLNRGGFGRGEGEVNKPGKVCTDTLPHLNIKILDFKVMLVFKKPQNAFLHHIYVLLKTGVPETLLSLRMSDTLRNI